MSYDSLKNKIELLIAEVKNRPASVCLGPNLADSNNMTLNYYLDGGRGDIAWNGWSISSYIELEYGKVVFNISGESIRKNDILRIL